MIWAEMWISPFPSNFDGKKLIRVGALEGGVGWPQTSTIFSVTSHFFVKNLLTSQKYIFYRWREQKRISRCGICHRPACLQSCVLTTLHTYYLTYLNLIYFLKYYFSCNYRKIQRNYPSQLKYCCVRAYHQTLYLISPKILVCPRLSPDLISDLI